jgi:putative ABC transport system permease protein
VFEDLAFWTGPTDFNLVTQDGSEKVRASFPSSSLFRVLRVEPQLGRGFLMEEDRPRGPQTVVISYKLWQERFGGDAQVLGRSLTVDTYGRRTYTIVGVMPPQFQISRRHRALAGRGIGTACRKIGEAGIGWRCSHGSSRGVTLAQAQAQMNGIQARLAQEHSGAARRSWKFPSCRCCDKQSGAARARRCWSCGVVGRGRVVDRVRERREI